MSGGGLAARLQLGLTGTVVEHEVLDEAAGLDVFQHLLHLPLGLFGDDPRAGGDVAIFGGIADRIAHVGDAAFIHQIDDQLHFVEAFEIGHFRRVTRFDQRFEPSLDQVGQAAAKHGLLAEQVGFAFFLEIGLDDAGTAATYARGISQRDVMGIAGGILMHCDQAGHAAALHIFAAHGVAGALRRDHDHVDIRRGLDQAEMDVEAVGESEGGTLLHVALKIVFPDRSLVFVGREDHQDVGPPSRFLVAQHLEAGAFGLLGACRTRTQGDGNFLDAAVAQVLRMGVALRTIAEHSDLLAGDEVKVRIGVIIDFHFFRSLSSSRLSIRDPYRLRIAWRPAVPARWPGRRAVSSFFRPPRGPGSCQPPRSARLRPAQVRASVRRSCRSYRAVRSVRK